MSATNFLVAASAGTGKTFALSSHVLRLLLLGEKPEAILALTFSRLAAAEIFDRVVGRLAAATESDAEAAKLSGELAEGEGGEPVRARFPGGVPRAEFLRVLRDFLAAQHRSRLGTIDSFMARLVQAFPAETGLRGDVRMVNVDFAYVEGKDVLHDVSVYAEPGQKVAFVGATGAGKTTITNLINRFYDIADGKIRYDGINVNKIRKKDLRRSLGLVLQDTNLFTGTVLENIRYGRLDATEEECRAAAQLAGADDFITRLPQGYDTVLNNNGANLSQGQRQLIAIARAAVADPPVMILDEATSSIDTRTEAIVQRGMDKLMEGRTVFVIAHRLSTVMNSDVIMVLDHGRIIERGSHEKLIAEKGTYYKLYTGAFELE